MQAFLLASSPLKSELRSHLTPSGKQKNNPRGLFPGGRGEIRTHGGY